MEKFISKSALETQALAAKLAKRIKSGQVIALFGDLGSGKTTFTQGLAKGLGVKENVNSPTFVLMKQYAISDQRSAISLIHIDLYRIKSLKEALNLGISDYLGKPEIISVIEWSEKIKSLLPNNTIKIHFKHLGEDKREINFK